MTTGSAPGDLRPPLRAVARYSTRALPAYRYVPGVHPHPLRDAAGHSYGRRDELPRPLRWRVEDWPQLEAWRYGVDLFNQFYFWEAHEAWEKLWATARPGSAERLLLQGLIQIAAALLKIHLGNSPGVRALSAAGLEKLRQVAAKQERLLGLDIESTASELDLYFAPLGQDILPPLDDSVPVLRLTPDSPGPQGAEKSRKKGISPISAGKRG